MRATDGRIRVLHVDDDADFTEVAATFVERESDRFDVETATSADEGLARLADGDYDCVVSDYDMPGRNGIEFLEDVREEYPDLPFLLYTGKGSEEVASEAISSGVTDYLQKESGTSQYAVLANRIENAVENYRTRRELLDRQRRLDLFVEQSPLGVIRWDDDYRAARVNDAAEEILGYSESELMGRSWEVIVPESERDEVAELVSELLEDEGGYHNVNENVRADGERIVCEWHNRVVTDDDGDVVAVYSQFQDVTDRKTQERRLETLIDNLPGMVYRCRNERGWPMEEVRGEVEELLGYPPSDVESRDDIYGREIIHPESREDVWNAVQSAVDAGESFELTYRIRTGDGETKWVWERGQGVYADGEVQALEGFVTDVTERERATRELRDTNTVLRTILENLPAGILVEDAERNVLMANQRLCDVLDLPVSPEELIGRDCAAAAADLKPLFADPGGFVENIEEAIDRREPIRGEELELADGRTLERDYVPYTLPDGNANLWFYRDVTERKEHERGLKQYENLVETLSAALPDYIFIYDADGEYRDVITGWAGGPIMYEPEELIGQTVDDLLEPETAETIHDAIDDALATGEIQTVEYPVETPAGPYWYEGQVAPIPDGYRGEPAVILTARDITDRRRRKRQLEEIQRRTQSLMHTSTKRETAQVAVDTVHEVLDAPLCGVHLLSEDERRIEPVALIDTVREELTEPLTYERGADSDPASETVWEAFEEGTVRVIDEIREDDPLAEVTPARSAIVHPLAGHGVLIASATEPHAFDDSDRALIEIVANVLTTALDRVEREKHLHERERELERKNEQLEQFASVVSHDLRNPLNVVQGRVELAREECDSDHLGDAKNAVDRSLALIEDLLALARGDGQETEMEQVDLKAVVEECWSNVETADATLDVAVEGAIQADSGRLKQLLENLIRNSVEHGGTDVTVAVGSLPDGFYVADDGPGIPEEERRQVFEAGYSTTHEGTGFGLSIVENVADAHGWDVAVTESDAGGARFEIVGVERAGD